MIPQLDPRVLHGELTAIRARRLAVFAGDPAGKAGEIAEKVGREVAPGLDPKPPSEPRPDSDAETRRLEARDEFRDAHAMRPVGLAFSGGGIRSATFNLGILHGLAEVGLLKYVDYLSTVSGGGYIGSWLHGLVRHNSGKIKDVETLLSQKTNAIPSTPLHDPVTFLRTYSNYLAPRPGLFTTDSWVIVSIWVRNVLLNQLILVPSLCAAIMLLVFAGFLQQLPVGIVSSLALSTTQAILALTALLLAVIISGANLSSVKERTQPVAAQRSPRATELRLSASRMSGAVVPLMFFTSVILACGGVEHSPILSGGTVAIAVLGLFLLFQLTGGFIECYASMRADGDGNISSGARTWAAFHVSWMAPVCAAVTVALIFSLWWVVLPSLPSPKLEAAWLRLAFGPPLMCLSMLTGAALLVGLMGVDYPDAAREWLARVGASLLLACVGWVGLFGVGIFGPFMFAWLLDHYALTGLTAIGAWGLTSAAGVIAGRSSRSNGSATGGSGGAALNVITAVAPTAFMIGYLLVLACVVHLSVRLVAGTSTSGKWIADATPTVYDVRVATPQATEIVQVDVKTTSAPAWLGRLLDPVVGFKENYWKALQWQEDALPPLVGVWLGLVGIALVASWRFNINEFSLHHFYKNRLVRCYLGASHTKDREPNPFTGFDPRDDFPLSSIVPGPRYGGPYAIVNAALNLSTGSELAQQERKATSFVFTPAYCGFQPVATREDNRPQSQGRLRTEGYCATRGFSAPEGPHLGTAMAISGAAANPNAGYHTSGPMAFLLTVFDARLGWWLGNPRRPAASKKPGPDFAWWYLFRELFGLTDARSDFVNVSDGGHFDNLGLYELVRRRCRYIIIGDGEQDGSLTFEGLGAAVRKCRADFGVEISINPRPLRLVNGDSQAHCVVGTIRYPEPEAGQPADLTGGDLQNGPAEYARGWLLYLKSSMTGDEPADVLEYRSKHKEFPHESTADQFFSESQFESYRRLGLHVVHDAFEGVPELDNSGDLKQMLRVFQYLTRKWYAPIPVTDEAATRLADSYSSLLKLSADNSMQQSAPDLLPQFKAPAGGGAQAPTGVASRVLWLEAIQLMQNVFTEFDLDFAANRANPRNAGWMNVFRRWTESSAFGGVWDSVRKDYNPIFQKFVDDLRPDKTGARESDKEGWPDAP